jgi:putative ABC transport system permease protein
MAFFSVLTGLIVLAGAVITGRYQRMQESVLLRTLGASRQQIQKIMLIEYFFLGSFAALSGILLALASSWALAYFLFETLFVPAFAPLLLAFVLIVGLTMGIGMLGSRGICDRPPLEVLRSV